MRLQLCARMMDILRTAHLQEDGNEDANMQDAGADAPEKVSTQMTQPNMPKDVLSYPKLPAEAAYAATQEHQVVADEKGADSGPGKEVCVCINHCTTPAGRCGSKQKLVVQNNLLCLGALASSARQRPKHAASATQGPKPQQLLL